MKHTLLITAVAVLSALSLSGVHTFADDDSAGGREELLAKMTEYLNAMDSLSISEAEAEADFMISAVDDSLFRNKVAVEAYRHFRSSRLMGSENVAVHIYDRWFATHKAFFEDMDELDEAQLYAFINRKSLIGCRAPQLESIDENADTVSVRFDSGRRTIVYFYSVGCPKCMYISLTMSKYLNEVNPDVDLVTIYTGDDDASWRLYLERDLKVTAPRVKVLNLCAAQTEFVTSYGVIQTPRLFLIDAEGVIIGRNLDTKSLSKLL